MTAGRSGGEKNYLLELQNNYDDIDHNKTKRSHSAKSVSVRYRNAISNADLHDLTAAPSVAMAVSPVMTVPVPAIVTVPVPSSAVLKHQHY